MSTLSVERKIRQKEIKSSNKREEGEDNVIRRDPQEKCFKKEMIY